MHRPEAIAVGCSQGSFRALRVLLAGLDPRLTQALLICRHTLTDVSRLCELLASHSTLPIAEAHERQPVTEGAVHVAPAGYHLLVENDRHFALCVDGHVRYSRPSIDVMFGSATDVYSANLIGVVLTGANSDGAEGLARIRRRGGVAVVQTPEGAEAPAMPRAPLEQAGSNYCFPLEEIAPLLNRLCLAEPLR